MGLNNDNHKKLILEYPDKDHIVFDKRIKTKYGWVCEVDAIVAVQDDIVNLATDEKLKVALQVPINVYHEHLGYPGLMMTWQWRKYGL